MIPNIKRFWCANILLVAKEIMSHVKKINDKDLADLEVISMPNDTLSL